MSYTSYIECDPVRKSLLGSAYTKLEAALSILLRSRRQDMYLLRAPYSSEGLEIKDKCMVRIIRINNSIDYIVIGNMGDAKRVAHKIKAKTKYVVGAVKIGKKSEAFNVHEQAEAAREQAKITGSTFHLYNPLTDSLEALLNG